MAGGLAFRLYAVVTIATAGRDPGVVERRLTECGGLFVTIVTLKRCDYMVAWFARSYCAVMAAATGALHMVMIYLFRDPSFSCHVASLATIIRSDVVAGLSFC